MIVRTYGWIVLLGREGTVNSVLVGLGLVDRPLQILNTEFAVLIALVHILLPYMVFPLFSALAAQDPDLERAAQHARGRPGPHLPRGDAAAQPVRHPDGIGAGVHARGGRGRDAGTARRQGRADDRARRSTSSISTLNWPLAAAVAFVLVLLQFAIMLLYFGGGRRRAA